MTKPAIKLAAPDLQHLTGDIFVAAGMPEAAAAKVAEVLVWANLRGADSHGVQRIPRYVELIDDGAMNPRPAMRVAFETPAASLIEADRAAGPVAMSFATTEAVRKARGSGIGLALVRQTTHTAAQGYYTAMAARDGMAALSGSCSSPNMIYYGARAAGVSTSPLSIAVPGAARDPLVLDMATGVVAMGKIVHARRTGQRLEPGWAVDAEGKPTTDPARAALPLPLGGPKGSGLSLMIECIASLITANPLLADTFEGKPEGEKHRQNAFLIAIDIARFCDLDLFQDNVRRLVAGLKSLPRQPDVDEVLMPGERGSRMLARRSRDGIPIPAATWSELGRVARRFGLSMPTNADGSWTAQ